MIARFIRALMTPARDNPNDSANSSNATKFQNKMEEELEAIIQHEKLKPELARKFVENASRDGALRTTGTDLDAILPAVSIFSKNKDETRAAKRGSVIEKLKGYFEKFFGLI